MNSFYFSSCLLCKDASNFTSLLSSKMQDLYKAPLLNFFIFIMNHHGFQWIRISDIAKFLGYRRASYAIRRNFPFESLKFKDFKRRNKNIKCNALFTTISGITHLIANSRKSGLVKDQIKQEFLKVCIFINHQYTSNTADIPAVIAPASTYTEASTFTSDAAPTVIAHASASSTSTRPCLSTTPTKVC